MEIEICDFDCFGEDVSGESRFVLYTKDRVNLPFKVILDAHILVSSSGKTLPCKICHPKPNGRLDPPMLHMKTDAKLGLRRLMSNGDIIIVK